MARWLVSRDRQRLGSRVVRDVWAGGRGRSPAQKRGNIPFYKYLKSPRALLGDVREEGAEWKQGSSSLCSESQRMWTRTEIQTAKIKRTLNPSILLEEKSDGSKSPVRERREQ